MGLKCGYKKGRGCTHCRTANLCPNQPDKNEWGGDSYHDADGYYSVLYGSWKLLVHITNTVHVIFYWKPWVSMIMNLKTHKLLWLWICKRMNFHDHECQISWLSITLKKKIHELYESWISILNEFLRSG